MLRDLWLNHKMPLLCLLAGVLAGWLLSWHGPAPAPMNRGQEQATRVAVATRTQAAARDTARAARARAAAATATASGQALARNARQYHRLTTPAHAPLPASPSAAAVDSLQRFLATYAR